MVNGVECLELNLSWRRLLPPRLLLILLLVPLPLLPRHLLLLPGRQLALHPPSLPHRPHLHTESVRLKRCCECMLGAARMKCHAWLEAGIHANCVLPPHLHAPAIQHCALS